MTTGQDWAKRVVMALHDGGPLYVTPEEYAQIKQAFSVAPVPDSGYGPRSTYPAFAGLSVVIDADKVAAQRYGIAR